MPEDKNASPTHRNKVGIYDDTKALLIRLKRDTGIPYARLVQDALGRLAKRSSRRRKSQQSAA